MTSRDAATGVPLHPLLTSRWSPRGFDVDAPVTAAALAALLEAARWAPSSGNGQPWRFAVARRGDDLHARLVETLKPGNRTWAPGAPVLLVVVAETADADGRERPTALLDVGLALGALTLQASHEGLSVHAMAGFDADAAREVLDLPERLRPLVVVAVGRHDPDAPLDDGLRERETAPRRRVPLGDLLLAGTGADVLEAAAG